MPSLFGHGNVGVQFVGRVVAGADHQDGDLAHIVGQHRIGGHGQRQVPDRLADRRLVQPGIPRPHQGAVLALDLEGVEVAGDAFAHASYRAFCSEVSSLGGMSGSRNLSSHG
jgi:hypothetical protein